MYKIQKFHYISPLILHLCNTAVVAVFSFVIVNFVD